LQVFGVNVEEAVKVDEAEEEPQAEVEQLEVEQIEVLPAEDTERYLEPETIHFGKIEEEIGSEVVVEEKDEWEEKMKQLVSFK
jgi:hypothetical protein